MYPYAVRLCTDRPQPIAIRIGVWGDPLQTNVCELVCAAHAHPINKKKASVLLEVIPRGGVVPSWVHAVVIPGLGIGLRCVPVGIHATLLGAKRDVPFYFSVTHLAGVDGVICPGLFSAVVMALWCHTIQYML
jgi:hypothetical protein